MLLLAEDGVVKRAARFNCWTKIYVQVIDPGTVFLSAQRDTLIQTAQVGRRQGIAVTSAAGPLGIVEMSWIGDLWYSADVINPPGVAFNLEVPKEATADGSPS